MLRNMLAFKRPANATLLRVDPDICTPWVRHNRDYQSLTPERCADLIEGLISQGRQEFPAIVRRIRGTNQFEIICGARRHWAVTWLRQHGHPDFKYFVDVRDMDDEEAFRLADIENRDRADLSDYERAKDYAEALALYYHGAQKDMAAAMKVDPTWLSRYLQLAKLPDQVIKAFSDRNDIKAYHARTLKPLLDDPKSQRKLMDAARAIYEDQMRLRQENRPGLGAKHVIAELRKAAKPVTKANAQTGGKTYGSVRDEDFLNFYKKAGKLVLEFPDTISRQALSSTFRDFMNDQYPPKST